MSAAAEQYVQACRLKGATRALFEAIARAIPEGQTATPSIALDDLTVGYSEKTARTCRDRLIREGLVLVHDGGQGKVARYEIVGLAGERPKTAAPLPLVGRAKPPEAKRRRSTSVVSTDVLPLLGHSTSVISTEVPTRTSVVFTDVARYFGNFYRSTRAYFGSFYRCCVALVVYVSRARAVRKNTNTKYVGVPAPATESTPDVVQTFLDWFAAEYVSAHQGARCAIDPADGDRIRDQLRRGRTLERLQAMTLALWRTTSDGVPGSERWYIAERAPVRNIWLLCRKADFLDRAVIAPARASPRVEIPYELYERGIEDERRRRGGS